MEAREGKPTTVKKKKKGKAEKSIEKAMSNVDLKHTKKEKPKKKDKSKTTATEKPKKKEKKEKKEKKDKKKTKKREREEGDGAGAAAGVKVDDFSVADLDAMFKGIADRKKAKVEKAETEAKDKKRRRKEMEEKVKSLEENHRAANHLADEDEPTPLFVDKEGDRIFSMAALKIGQGGGTPLCPFDCDCCF